MSPIHSKSIPSTTRYTGASASSYTPVIPAMKSKNTIPSMQFCKNGDAPEPPASVGPRMSEANTRAIERFTLAGKAAVGKFTRFPFDRDTYICLVQRRLNISSFTHNPQSRGARKASASAPAEASSSTAWPSSSSSISTPHKVRKRRRTSRHYFPKRESFLRL